MLLRKSDILSVLFSHVVLHVNIDQTLVKSLHPLLICEIGELHCRVITKKVFNT